MKKPPSMWHAHIQIGCPKKEHAHAAFHIEVDDEGVQEDLTRTVAIICDNCGEDFYDNLEIMRATIEGMLNGNLPDIPE